MMAVRQLFPDDETWFGRFADMLQRTGSGKTTTEWLTAMVRDNHTLLFIAIGDEKVVGYSLVYWFPHFNKGEYHAYLYDIEVEESYRRNGLGTRLIEASISALKKQGVCELWLGTGTGNEAAQALFTATGAIRSGETFNDFTYELAKG